MVHAVRQCRTGIRRLRLFGQGTTIDAKKERGCFAAFTENSVSRLLQVPRGIGARLSGKRRATEGKSGCRWQLSQRDRRSTDGVMPFAMPSRGEAQPFAQKARHRLVLGRFDGFDLDKDGRR